MFGLPIKCVIANGTLDAGQNTREFRIVDLCYMFHCGQDFEPYPEILEDSMWMSVISDNSTSRNT